MFAENTFETLANAIVTTNQILRPALVCLKRYPNIAKSTEQVIKTALETIGIRPQENCCARIYKGEKHPEIIFGPRTFHELNSIVSWTMDTITPELNSIPGFVLAVAQHTELKWHHIFVLYY